MKNLEPLFLPGFIRRQLTTNRQQALLFVLCVALSLVSLVALHGFGESINRALLRDAKVINGGDIIIEANFPWSQPLVATLAQIEARGEAVVARTAEFASVVRQGEGEETLLCNLKGVDPHYPLYGAVELASGRALAAVLVAGQMVVEQAVLDRLQLQVGDTLHVGQSTLTIADVLVREPDRPVNLFTLGPRIFIAQADLAGLDLIKPGSRVNYKMLLRLPDESGLTSLVTTIKKSLSPQERAESYRTRQSGVQRFYNSFLLFLNVAAILTLLLAGVGIQAALTALLRQRTTTIAIIKTLGATTRFVTANFLAVVAILGGIGGLLGIGLGALLLQGLPWLLRDLLPPNVVVTISGRAFAESVLLGLVVVGAFTFLPIYQLQELKPIFILRREVTRLRYGWPFWVALGMILLFFVGMVLWQLGDLRRGIWFVLGVIGLLLIATALTYGLLLALRRLRVRDLQVRQALRGLFRPRNATAAITITFSAALAVIFCIYLLQANLDANFLQSYPPDTPNMFLLDIQPDQVAGVAEALGTQPEFYPVIRGTIATVNGEAMRRSRGEDGEERGPGMTRTFNLTYRDHLLEGEALVTGNALFAGADAAQVSVLDEIQEEYPFAVGDRIVFQIQGVPLAATVSSIRKRTAESFQPFFTFVLPPAALQKAPQSLFAALYVEPARIRPLQNRVVAAFPNVTVIDLTSTIANLASVVQRLARVIRFFTLFSVVAGVLIVISSIFATRLARMQEAAYYKVLGAKRRFVLTVFTLENLWLGLVSGLLALLMAQIGAWILCGYIFEIDYHPAVGMSVLLVVATILLVVAVGMVASLPILRHRPIDYLREQSAEE